MRLLYIHQYFNFPENKGGTRSYDLSKRFVEAGIDVTILTSSSSLQHLVSKKRWTYIEREGIKLWIVKSNYSHKMSIPKRIVSFIHFIYFAAIKALKIKSDIVLATSTPLTVAIPGIIKKKFSKIPFIFEVRDVWPEGPIQQGYVKNPLLIKMLRRSEKYIYKQADYVIPLSVGMKRDILSRVDVPKMEVIPNISEIDRFKNIDKTVNLPFDLTGKRVILYAGTLGPVNDIMYVAKLAKRLIEINPNIVFMIVGDGKQKKDIVKFCTDEGIINKNIFFVDPVSKDSLPYLYNKVTMGSSFVWDYKIKWDNSANKFFDTLAAGRPILINYLGWQADVINEHNCGYVLPYNWNDEDARKFSEYLMNTELIEEQGKNALKTAELFSLDVAAEKYLNVFNELYKDL